MKGNGELEGVSKEKSALQHQETREASESDRRGPPWSSGLLVSFCFFP